ncbi:MAG TPA: endolytic transglycosylase MltG [Actinomycetota bacterium]|nr:endolytic transglycosylase MltG [Actinomycetota bacterium]
MRRGCLGLIILLVLALGFVSFTFLSYHSATEGSSTGAPVTLTVPSGASLSGLEPQLHTAGVIGSTFDFKIWLHLSGSAGQVSSLQQGSYTLRKNMPYSELISTLAKGPSISYEKLTIPEGLTVTETAAKVGAETHIQAADFQAAATVASAQPTILPPGNASLEGFLYPQTYYVDPHQDAANLVQEMVAEFQTETASVDWSAAPPGITPYQVLTIASLIQNEAKVISDGPNIASVIYNRLAAHIPLGIDATVYYALDKPFTEKLTTADTQVKSPWNTYVAPGLPPTPISSPDLDYINAALHPAQTNYLYYVVGPDCIHSLFFSSYAAFSQAAANQPKC